LLESTERWKYFGNYFHKIGLK